MYGGTERNAWRARDGDESREGRRIRNDQWRSGGAGRIMLPLYLNPAGLERAGRGRHREDGMGRRERRNDRALNASPTRQSQRTQHEGTQATVPTPRAAPTPRPARTPPIVRRGRHEGVNIRDQEGLAKVRHI